MRFSFSRLFHIFSDQIGSEINYYTVKELYRAIYKRHIDRFYSQTEIMSNHKNVQTPVLEIPGLNWEKLTLKEARQQKCFLQQEFERWTENEDL